MNFPTLVRVSRSRAGLTLRAAHEMTRAIARLLGDPDYGIALGQLSDYEATDKLPRHIAKVMSLCMIYGTQVWDLTAAAGVRIDDSGKVPLAADEAGPDPLAISYREEQHWEEPDFCSAAESAAIGTRVRAARGVA